MIEIGAFFNDFKEFLLTPVGITSFVVLYAIWVSLLLPGSWLTFSAGVIYGLFSGSVILMLGALIGGHITFILGRTLLKVWVMGRITQFPKLQIVFRGVSKEGFKLVLLTRLSPAFPFSLLNLIYGVSDVSLRDFSLGMIGILPGTILYCHLGALAGDVNLFRDVVAGKDQGLPLFLSLLGFAATFALVALVARSASNSIQEFESSLWSKGIFQSLIVAIKINQ